MIKTTTIIADWDDNMRIESIVMKSYCKSPLKDDEISSFDYTLKNEVVGGFGEMELKKYTEHSSIATSPDCFKFTARHISENEIIVSIGFKK